MDVLQVRGVLRLIVARPMVVLWFVLALVLTMSIGFLNTQSRYVMDLKLLFISCVVMMGVAWLMNVLLLPVVRRSLFVPLLGIVSFISLLSDLGDELNYWAAFQWPVPWLNAVLYLAVALIFLSLLRNLINILPEESSVAARRIWLLAALPLLALLSWNFFSSHNYFIDQHGRVPVFHHGLSEKMLPGMKISSIDHFLGI